MAGSFITVGMNRNWGMASYVKAGVFLDHWVYGNEGFLGNENLKGNEDIHGNQRHQIMALESKLFE